MRSLDDIPEAVRESSSPSPRHRLKGPLWLWGLLGTVIALLAGGSLGLASRTLETAKITTLQPGFQTALAAPTDSLLGHLPYPEAPADTLVAIAGDDKIKLRRPAAEAFEQMVAAARADGVSLIPVSGFRSVADQEYVFFQGKAQQGESTTQRAEVSAPPGYSEHHTGYAVDLADGARPETELLTQSFDTTPAFQWLKENAGRFNFEMSFPKDNPQGVSYEPWHWRFVGDRNSLETFYRAKVMTLGGPQTP